MKNKLTKEKKLRGEVEALKSQLRTVIAERDIKSTLIQQIQGALKMTGYRDDIVAEVWRLVAIRDFFQGRRMPETEHILSLEKILRWTICPESAKDDEKIERFEEARRNGRI